MTQYIYTNDTIRAARALVAGKIAPDVFRAAMIKARRVNMPDLVDAEAERWYDINWARGQNGELRMKEVRHLANYGKKEAR